MPRLYRSKDIFVWLVLTGFFLRTPDRLPSPQAGFTSNPQVSGRDGGYTLNRHQFARAGVTLLEQLRGADPQRLYFAPGMRASLASADKLETELVGMIDRYIAEQGLDNPPGELPQLRDGYAQEEISELDLASAGIGSIIWAISILYPK